MQDFHLSPSKILIKFTLPHLVSMGFFSLYFIVDGIFVGKYLGSESLAALALVMPFVMISFALSDLIALGSSVQISIKLGLKKFKEANEIFSASMLLSMVLNLFIALFMLLFSPYFIELLNTTVNIKSLCKEVSLIFALFMPLTAISFMVDNYLRICAKTSYAMFINILIALSNIILDYIFIVLFGWGLFSAALATCIGFSLGSIFGILPFLSKKLTLSFTLPKISFKTIKNIIYNGSSEFFSNISASLFGIIVNFILLKLSGEKAIAAYSILMYIDSFIVMMMSSICESLQPILSYHFARKDKSSIKTLLKMTILMLISFSLIILSLLLIFAEHFIRLFANSNEKAFIEFSLNALFYFCPVYIFAWFNLLCSSFTTAFNQPRFSLALSLTENLIFPTIFILTLPYFMGLNGIWLSPFMANLLLIFMAFIFLKKSIRF